jgi:hypothetical protein
MFQTPRSIGLISFAALAAVLTSPVAFAGTGKPVNGRFEGALGVLEFETEPSGHVVGRYGEGGPCSFDPRRPVVDGEFEGSVFVGTVTLCQTGPVCEERAYSILAFTDADGVLAADVKLEPGCQSPALVGGTRLVLKSAPGSVPNTVLASGKKPKKKSRAMCIEDLKRGALLLQKRDYAGASYYFEEGLECDEANWAAHLGIGISELRRGRVEVAMDAFGKAKNYAVAKGQEDAEIDFNLACGFMRLNDRTKALEALSRSVQLGWSDPKTMLEDPDLQPLREDPTFKSLVDKAWNLQSKQPSKDSP